TSHGTGITNNNCSILLVGVRSGVISTSSLGISSLYAAGASTSEGRLEGEVNVLLRVETDNERRNVDDLATDAAKGYYRVPIYPIKHKKAALKEVLDAETEHVIELHAVLGEHSNTNETTEKGISFEETAR
ncbi:hypothetical protein PRIPAC_90303, partial [Pristionchus pacificus]|uniref:Uncharacterized protein n=1 Tax=Pristionchus pacificus TaxID=54126 RepID=A0A2A6B8V9_PRIPA